MEGQKNTRVEVDEAGHPVTRVDLQLEREKIQLERERMALEREKLEAERERWKLEEGWRTASERGIKVRLVTTVLAGTCCLLLGCLLGGVWLVSQQDRLEEERDTRRRRKLVQALTSETNIASRAEALLQTLQDDGGGQSGILLILN